MVGDAELEGDVRALLARWTQAYVARDAAAYADLFHRGADPVVAWATGEVTRGWKPLFEHVQREFYHQKAVVKSVDVHDLSVARVHEELAEAAFRYDVLAVDLWGTTHTLHRLATMTLVATKDGWRVVGAHFSTVAP